LPNQRRPAVLLALVAGVVTAVPALSACGVPAGRTRALQPAATHPGAAGTAAATGAPAVTVAPAPGTRGAPVTTEITVGVGGGVLASVTLTGPDGRPVPGAVRADGSSWVPARPLAYGQRYTATVTARGPGGAATVRGTTFSTMTAPGGARIGTGLYFFDGATYGVAMPVVVEFDTPIPDAAKATVQHRLFVTSDPPQPGAWRWYGDRQVLFRPRVYWQPGTRLTVRAALGGLPVGGRLLDTDRGGTATIGARQLFLVRDGDKSLSVYRSGRLVRRFPVSLGKPSTPTSSGTLVIMSRDTSTRFKTSQYELTAYYAERLTWGGQYFHAAPWSVAQQGSRNVSHGCVNLSLDSAHWVYQHSRIGDPVAVTGTPVHIDPGDGWTVWDMPWSEYVQGSGQADPEPPGSLAGPGGEPVTGTIRVVL